MLRNQSIWCHVLIVILTAFRLMSGLASEIAQPDAERHGPRSSHPVAAALWQLRNYDIYDSPVIIQTVFSPRLDTTVLLLPEERSQKPKTSADWKIEVVFPVDQHSKPRVTTSGVIRRIAADSEKYKLGLAVIEAMDRFDEAKLLAPNIPGVLQAIQREDYYAVYLSPLPRIPGGDFGVRLSRDLKEYSIIRGH